MEFTTCHAPAERESIDKIKEQAGEVEQDVIYDFIWKRLPVSSLILNQRRQIVAGNELFFNMVGRKKEDVIGMRPGEVVGCIRAHDEDGGCGTAKHCTVCGAVEAVLTAIGGTENSKNSTILVDGNNTLELNVWALPIHINGEMYIAVAMQDIRNEVRRRSLERTFFHDINNTLTCLLGYSEMLYGNKDSADDKQKGIMDKLRSLIIRLVEEISEQNILLAAERGDLKVKFKEVESRCLVEDIVMQYDYTEVDGAERIKIRKDFENIFMDSDKVLLSRVIGNMIKNGLEAGGKYAEITVGCNVHDGKVRFSVHNPGMIPEKNQLQIFQRSFSTKGEGRGIGTYSMKFLSMNYLKGDISFESTEQDGTTFYAEYPYN